MIVSRTYREVTFQTLNVRKRDARGTIPLNGLYVTSSSYSYVLRIYPLHCTQENPTEEDIHLRSSIDHRGWIPMFRWIASWNYRSIEHDRSNSNEQFIDELVGWTLSTRLALIVTEFGNRDATRVCILLTSVPSFQSLQTPAHRDQDFPQTLNLANHSKSPVVCLP